jgi:exosortase/archaeosortase
MAQLWNWIWLTVAFVAELAALAALAVWGWTAPGATPVRVLLAAGLPLAAAALWGMFAAPHAPIRRPVLALTVKVAVFGSGVLALLAIGQSWLAIALAAAALLSSVLSTPPAPAA